MDSYKASTGCRTEYYETAENEEPTRKLSFQIDSGNVAAPRYAPTLSEVTWPVGAGCDELHCTVGYPR